MMPMFSAVDLHSRRRTLVRKLATPLGLVSLAVVLMGAGVAASAPGNGAAPHIFTDSGMTLRLTSTMPGVTFTGSTLMCPPMSVTTSSGVNHSACEFTIESTGSIVPGTIAVNMSVTGITAAQVSGHKFAIDPNPGPLVYLATTSQTISTFTGAQLPVTVHPGVAWGADVGNALDNSDLGATIVVTYTVVAEALEGATGRPTAAPTSTPFESFAGETAIAVHTSTPPPTSSGSDSSSNEPAPLFPLLICFLLAAIGLAAAEFQRRSVPRRQRAPERPS
jgi:hypothetical protein